MELHIQTKEYESKLNYFVTSPKWEDLFMCFICGYGVRPFNTLFASSVAVLLFTLFYMKCSELNFFDSLYFSFATFIGFGNDYWKPKSNFRKYVLFERLLGWLALGLFVVTLTKVMIRP